MDPISALIDQLRQFIGRPKPTNLDKHIHQTYFSLRFGIGALSFLLPGILWLGGMIKGLPLQNSMSAYYHASSGAMRDIFVGCLLSVAFALYAYTWFSRRETVLLNCAGTALAGVALFPMQWACADSCSKLSLHTLFTIGFFGLVGWVCFFRSSDTLILMSDREIASKYKAIYRAIGAAFWAGILLGLLLYVMNAGGSYLFFMEAANVWIFSFYWFIKTAEINRTGADEAAAAGKVDWSNRESARGLVPAGQ